MPHVNLREADLPEVLIHDFKHNGYLPEILLNFLALLGWNPGGDREHLSMAQLVELFTIEGIGKSNAKFDRAKLLSFNTELGNQIDPANLVKPLRDYLSVNPESLLNKAPDEELVDLIKMKKGFRTLREIDEPCRCFFMPDDQITLDPAAVEKVLKKNDFAGLKALKDARKILSETTPWTHDAMEANIKAYCEQSGLGLGNVAQPIRVAVSGTTISPPIFHSLQFLGKERSLKRLDRCLERVM
jgi:glutamyl-tRNA synthetase